jgi:hypothetical protein
MEKAKIKLSLDIGMIDGRSMSLKISNGTELIIDKNSFDSNKEHVQFEVNLPICLEFVTDGKGPNDTVVGPDLSIVSDMHIKISRLSIDNMPVKTWVLEKFLFSGESISGQTFTTNYIGYNGTTKLNIDHESSFEFFLDILAEG